MIQISKLRLFSLFFAVAGVGAYFLFFAGTKYAAVSRGYHQSQFSRYAPFVESSVKKITGGREVALDRVVGGIVSHHIPTTIPVLADFYSRLKNARQVKTFIILGPDHVDGSRGDINVSKAEFIMPFATLKPDLDIIGALERSGFVISDEAPFVQEHSIGSQALLISKFFPDARIVPLIFRSSLANDTAKSFGKILAASADENTFIVASVDFSHYLPARQARPIDGLSASVLDAVDPDSVGLINADSPQSLTAFMAYLQEKNATAHDDLEILNTKDFNDNSDFTTGYVFGFWGVRRETSRGRN